MRFTGGTSDGTATAGHPSGRNGRIDLSRPQSFPRSLASRTHQAFVALLSAGSLFFLAACGGGPPAAPGQTPTNPRLLPVPAWNLCDRRETVLMVEAGRRTERSEEHTSELQSQSNLVCRLLLEKKKHARCTVRSP